MLLFSLDLSEWRSDAGYITNMTALPVTAFQYGHLAASSRANVSVGRLVCEGQKVFQDAGTSCEALR